MAFACYAFATPSASTSRRRPTLVRCSSGCTARRCRYKNLATLVKYDTSIAQGVRVPSLGVPTMPAASVSTKSVKS
jgi:hypothetical protein